LGKLADWPKGGRFTDGLLNSDGSAYTGPDNWRSNPFPCPRMAAEIRMDAAPRGARLDLRRAAAFVDGEKTVAVRALAVRNVFLIETDASARIVAWPTSYDFPAPETGERGGVAYLYHKYPGDLDWPGMSVAVALAANGKRKAAVIVTSLDAADPLAEAVRLASATVRESPAVLAAAHEAEWARFWSASGVDLADDMLRQTWYQNLYFIRCVSKPGAGCVGMYAGQVSDRPAWHGGHTSNYNIEQTYWTVLNTNHPEIQEPYDRMISNYIPRAQWLCRQLFDVEGAYFPHNLLMHEPPDPAKCRSRNARQNCRMTWSYTLGVSGFTVQNLWFKYKYTMDRGYLERVAYPAIRGVARFYANWLERCERRPDGTVRLGPTVSAEHWGWTRGLERNWNCTLDIAMARYLLRAAIEGAETLGRDAELAASCRRALALVPPYPTTGAADPVVVDVEGAPPIVYNITIPTIPVFPGDDVTCFSPPAQKALFSRTLDAVKWNGNNSAFIMSIGRARMSLPGAREYLRREIKIRRRPNRTITLNRRGAKYNDYGHYTEQFASAYAVGELLVQSAGDILRVFPAWPGDKDARYANLRAQGGFLVSGEIRGGVVQPVRITSTAGGPLRILNPWPGETVRVTQNGKTAQAEPDSRGVLAVATARNDTIAISRLPIRQGQSNAQNMVH
jgi:alpha-L-fucosidase 2